MKDRKEYYKQWREKNKEHIKEKEKERNTSNDRIVWKKEYQEKNKEKFAEYSRNFRKNNPDKIKEYDKKRDKEQRRISRRKSYKKRRENDPIFRMSENIRRQILLSLQRGGYSKNSKTEQILGCSYYEFKLHLEKQFEPWMNWENYGKYNGELNYGWDIDHVIPVSFGDTEDELIKLNHYSNLKPLCSKVNRDLKRNNPHF